MIVSMCLLMFYSISPSSMNRLVLQDLDLGSQGSVPGLVQVSGKYVYVDRGTSLAVFDHSGRPVKEYQLRKGWIANFSLIPSHRMVAVSVVYPSEKGEYSSMVVLLDERGDLRGELVDPLMPEAYFFFYDLQNDGFSLDDKRDPIADNDLPDALERWRKRSAKTDVDRTAKHFMVPVEQIEANDFDLSINRYKQAKHEAVEYDPPNTIIARLRKIEAEIADDLNELEAMF